MKGMKKNAAIAREDKPMKATKKNTNPEKNQPTKQGNQSTKKGRQAKQQHVKFKKPAAAAHSLPLSDVDPLSSLSDVEDSDTTEEPTSTLEYFPRRGAQAWATMVDNIGNAGLSLEQGLELASWNRSIGVDYP